MSPNESQLEPTNSIPIASTKRGRGRPSKYAPEERDQKYKELTKQWQQNHADKQFECVKDYQDRSRFALKLLNELWNDNLIEIKSDRHRTILQDLIEHKKITV
jgi:hypothetical protein